MFKIKYEIIIKKITINTFMIIYYNRNNEKLNFEKIFS